MTKNGKKRSKSQNCEIVKFFWPFWHKISLERITFDFVCLTMKHYPIYTIILLTIEPCLMVGIVINNVFLCEKQRNIREKSDKNLQKQRFPVYFPHLWPEKKFLKNRTHPCFEHSQYASLFKNSGRTNDEISRKCQKRFVIKPLLGVHLRSLELAKWEKYENSKIVNVERLKFSPIFSSIIRWFVNLSAWYNLLIHSKL